MDVSLSTLGLLAGVAALAGFVDAIGGGGGLLTVPALVAAGLPPHVVFGTNKGAAIFGSFAATIRFARAKLIDRSFARVVFPLAIAGSSIGAALVLAVSPHVLRPLVLILLALAGVLVTIGRAAEPRPPVQFEGDRRLMKGAIIALSIGAYDGFFGPGTGTFLIIALSYWVRQSLTQASANAKVVNFGSNAAAVAIFAWQGVIEWKVALPMALGQLIGGTLGAHVVIRGGSQVVRRVVLLVVFALIAHLAVDLAST